MKAAVVDVSVIGHSTSASLSFTICKKTTVADSVYFGSVDLRCSLFEVGPSLQIVSRYTAQKVISCFFSITSVQTLSHWPKLDLVRQEAQLSPRDRALRRVS